MPQKAEKTLNDLIDEAVQELPFFKRLAYGWRLQLPRFRQRVIDDLRVKLHQDPRVHAMGIYPVSAFAEDSFTADTPFEIDPDQLERILQIIVEYLPQIVQIISALFASIMLLFVIGFTARGDAVASEPVALNPYSRAEIHAVAHTLAEATVQSTAEPAAASEPVKEVSASEVTVGDCSPVAACGPTAVQSATACQPVRAAIRATPIATGYGNCGAEVVGGPGVAACSPQSTYRRGRTYRRVGPVRRTVGRLFSR